MNVIMAWRNEMSEMFVAIDRQAIQSLGKINLAFKRDGLSFDQDFKRYFLTTSKERLDAAYFQFEISLQLEEKVANRAIASAKTAVEDQLENEVSTPLQKLAETGDSNDEKDTNTVHINSTSNISSELVEKQTKSSLNTLDAHNAIFPVQNKQHTESTLSEDCFDTCFDLTTISRRQSIQNIETSSFNPFNYLNEPNFLLNFNEDETFISQIQSLAAERQEISLVESNRSTCIGNAQNLDYKLIDTDRAFRIGLSMEEQFIDSIVDDDFDFYKNSAVETNDESNECDQSEHFQSVQKRDFAENMDRSNPPNFRRIENDWNDDQDSTIIVDINSQTDHQSNVNVNTNRGMLENAAQQPSRRLKMAKPFNCQLCSYSSATKGNLGRHMRTHTGEKPYRCDICRKEFTNIRNLNKHKVIHIHEFPFHCRCCFDGFSQQEERNAHEKACKKCRYECHICLKFVSLIKTKLKMHMRTHNGEKPFRCDLCWKCFTEKGTLKRHLETIHSGINRL